MPIGNFAKARKLVCPLFASEEPSEGLDPESESVEVSESEPVEEPESEPVEEESGSEPVEESESEPVEDPESEPVEEESGSEPVDDPESEPVEESESETVEELESLDELELGVPDSAAVELVLSTPPQASRFKNILINIIDRNFTMNTLKQHVFVARTLYTKQR